MMYKSRGFTLIEIAIVLVINGHRPQIMKGRATSRPFSCALRSFGSVPVTRTEA